MIKKTVKGPLKKIRKKKTRPKAKPAKKAADKNKLAFIGIRKDFKRLKRSKQKMQVLWYRTKKEHLALMKDLDKRIKELKADIRKSKR